MTVRQPPGVEPRWAESWYFDFATAAGDDVTGGFLRLSLFPNLGVAWLWAAWVAGDRLVIVRDHEVPLPRGAGLEVRAGGLWADLICETAATHWTLGLEAFGLGLDDPVEALGAERGERVPLGFDLEWEAAEPAFTFPEPTARPHHGHVQHGGRVHGDVLVGADRIAFDGWGVHDHFWGVRDWWGAGWHWAGGRVESNLAFSVAHPDTPGPEHATGYTARDGEDPHPVAFAEIETERDARGLPRSATYRFDSGLAVDATVVGLAPLRIPSLDGGRDAQLIRALCRFTAPNSSPGAGWAEWLSTPRG
ncbi:MAG TPA: hypothetical protein VI916_08695 [Acidimicrobiia bacterium]|nr:hypothetical protein [Acidimicrobiia bacterium]